MSDMSKSTQFMLAIVYNMMNKDMKILHTDFTGARLSLIAENHGTGGVAISIDRNDPSDICFAGIETDKDEPEWLDMSMITAANLKCGKFFFEALIAAVGGAARGLV